MKIEILYFEGCPNHRPAVERVKEVLKAEGAAAEVVEVNVPDEAAARSLGFLGSPSIRMNGLDVEPSARSSKDFGMMCRTYTEGGRSQGLPSRELIRKALQEATEEAPARHDCCKVPAPAESISEPAGAQRKGLFLGASLAAAIGASLCCIIPLVFAGAGVTAMVIADKFAAIRPYFLVVTGLLLLAGFYFAYRPVKVDCEPGAACGTPDSRKRARLGLWLATALALALTTLPYWSAAWIRSTGQKANLSTLQAAGIPIQRTSLRVSGMVCEVCAANIEKTLRTQAGVRSARVSFPQSAAEVEYDPSQVSLSQIRGLIEKAGYQIAGATSRSE